MNKQMFAKMAALLTLGVLYGSAASGQNLNAPAAPIASTASLNGARLALAVPESPSFLARTPPDWKDTAVGAVGGMVGGAIGGVARASSQASDGDRMVKEFAIADPALPIGQGLATRLRTTYRMTEVPATPAPVTQTVDAVIASAPTTDMILDVRSQVFGLNYTPKEPTNFFVMSISWARLIDARSHAVLAEARCIPVKSPPMQKFDQLVANNGEGIKAGLAAYVDPCVEQLAEKMKL
ncbi:hypothetical protein [Variovorax sp. PAMC26660]|uniref:hypothetical protein n=1 Tax=Variovorax sp. PAMC26660 TaxID=2762322 RepID=UPI00164E6FFD|nr:hypothetical protein [Variovorax sp. PAMC26660]QNK67632.1 hypothetical protein H7F35_31590 [Variovorax sp. PAMC26660]